MMNNDISRLRKNRVVNFKLGLITSLSFVIMAFNFTSHPFTESIHEGCTLKFDDEEVKIERTSQRKTPPLPEVNISDHIESVDEVALTEPVEPQPISIDIEKGPEPFFIDPFEGDIDEIEPEVEEDWQEAREGRPRSLGSFFFLLFFLFLLFPSEDELGG